MKATGIVRRIDELGRLVIPKEVRRSMNIANGDSLEIFVDNGGEVILKKYSPVKELERLADEYAQSLNSATKHIAMICDKDIVVSLAGAPQGELMNRPIGKLVAQAIEDRKPVMVGAPGQQLSTADSPIALEEGETSPYTWLVVAPIVSQGDALGAVCLLTRDTGAKMGDLEMKLSITAAGFLARQIG